MLKSKFFRITSMLIASALLVGCGNDDAEESGGDSDNGSSGDVTTVTLALWDQNQEPVLREILDEFEEENPHINVEFELTAFGQYWTRLEAAVSGEVMPDIVWMNGPNFISYASNGIITPIDPYLEDGDIDFSNYPDSLVELYTYEDELYGLPKDWDTTAVWYNKDMFDDAGIDYPEDDWTWDEMIEMAESLTDVDNNVYGIAGNISTQEGIYNQIFQNDGFVISDDLMESGYDDPNTIEAFKYHVELHEKGISPSIDVLSETGPRDLFTSERLAMAYLASWNIPVILDSDIADSVNVVEMPKLDRQGAVVHGLTYALSSNSEHKEEAAEVIKYLASEDANVKWAESGVVIPAYENVLDIWINSNTEVNLGAYVNALDYSSPYPISMNTSTWNDYEQQAINDIYSLNVDIEDRLNELADQMNEALEQEKN